MTAKRQWANDSLPLPLHLKQREILRAILNARLGVLLPGPFGTGKTHAGLLGFMIWSQNEKLGNPRGDYLVASKTLKQASDILVPIMGGVADLLKLPFREKNDKNNFEVWVGDARYLIKGADNEQAAERIRGNNFNGFFLDELVLLPQSFFNEARTRTRKAGGRRMVATCNPASPRHWVKMRIIDPAYRHFDLKNEWGSWVIVPSMISDNPSLPDTYAEELQETYTGPALRRALYGEWAAAAGAIFPEFRTQEADNGAHWNQFLGIDYGSSGNTHALLFTRIDMQPYWSVVDEWVSTRQMPDQYIVDQLVARYPMAEKWVIDPAALAFRQLASRKVVVVDTNNAVLEGIGMVDAWLHNGNLRISKTCKTLVGQMYNYEWNDKATARGVDEPTKSDDHGVDALRYGVMAIGPPKLLSGPFKVPMYEHSR